MVTASSSRQVAIKGGGWPRGIRGAPAARAWRARSRAPGWRGGTWCGGPWKRREGCWSRVQLVQHRCPGCTPRVGAGRRHPLESLDVEILSASESWAMAMTSKNSFGARDTLAVGAQSYEIFRLGAV